MMTIPQNIIFNQTNQQVECLGAWDLAHLNDIQMSLATLELPPKAPIVINGGALDKMDSAGAWALIAWQAGLVKQGMAITREAFAATHEHLLSIIEKNLELEKPVPDVVPPSTLQQIGMVTMNALSQFTDYLSFIGQLSFESLRIFKNPSHIRWNALAGVIYRNGFLALPIIALLSFMIGVVITYQMGLQLKSYGANIYIVDLLGLAITREFAPLLTAIMVAGRTGSAFTAQLGMMKLNQEIDALNTMGVTPGELLLLPRIIGLFIALPLLTMWADMFGVFGGMVMANNMLSITWYDFLHRFPTVIPLRSFLIGLGKAPVFALIIASVGCYQGMKVRDSADSLGENTTRSVVLSIFFIIVADALFSIILSKLKL
jgi:phospholipid/cholesterol/gamma-HCH transport system permease protein